ncbi:hypothetical protein [Pseudomonas helvetica]|uniref:hypothetical protein n=1 Tax=Pseudomonas helvetica TaxID=3136738 RepID=UPI00326315C3
MKTVYLISNVNNGGKTYLEYLLPALNALRDKYNCIVLQTNTVGISKHEAEQILNSPVEEVELTFIAMLRSQTVISNDASIGRLLDESNFGIFIAHGNVGMPIDDKYYCSDWTSHWDAIVSSSRSLFDLIKAGLQLYRHDRHALRKVFEGRSLRSDLRKTSAISTLPVKIPEPFRFPPDYLRTADEYVVGLLPTQKGICPSGATLYENMETIINSVKSTIPHATFILRPYMTDVEAPYVKELCGLLSQYQWISIDESKESSKEFYQRCDTLITDASSGGVSFMLNTCRLPIYYVPAASESNPIVKAWLKQMSGLLPIANSGDRLKEIAIEIESLTPDEHFLRYQKFHEEEYSDLHHPNEVFQDLVQKQHESDFRYCSIDSFGEIDKSEISHQESVLQPS